MPENKDPNDRRVPRMLEAPEPGDCVLTRSVDHRIRSSTGDYRVVAPGGTQKGNRFFVNSSPMIIEKRGKDARGVEKWDLVTTFAKQGDTEIDVALYWLLAGPDAE